MPKHRQFVKNSIPYASLDICYFTKNFKHAASKDVTLAHSQL